MVRLDSTVTAALMHEPSDSSLLWDAVRVMVRLLWEAQAWVGGSALAWREPLVNEVWCRHADGHVIIEVPRLEPDPKPRPS